jgi:hypothetical protein
VAARIDAGGLQIASPSARLRSPFTINAGTVGLLVLSADPDGLLCRIQGGSPGRNDPLTLGFIPRGAALKKEPYPWSSPYVLALAADLETFSFKFCGAL